MPARLRFLFDYDAARALEHPAIRAEAASPEAVAQHHQVEPPGRIPGDLDRHHRRTARLGLHRGRRDHHGHARGQGGGHRRQRSPHSSHLPIT